MPYADKSKRNEYQRQRLAKNRVEWFSNKLCAGCGSRDRLELDHKDRSLKISHRIWSWNKARREAELAKCEALCHDCHVKKTKRDMNYGIVHGTLNGYYWYDCRCPLCRVANTTYRREHRKKTGHH